MLGHRGVRLGITYPEITEMQTRAIIEAACQLAKEGVQGRARDHDSAGRPREASSATRRPSSTRVGREVMKEQGVKVEVSRRHDDRGAARRGDGRRDRRGGRVLLVRDQRPDAADLRVLARRHREVPGGLPGPEDSREGSVRVARHRRRRAAWCGWPSRKAAPRRPDLKLGVCGEHGGDPASIHFFEKVGLDYVSCSPYRVPCRLRALAAAQAGSEGSRVGD